ncbi:MAG: DinB family protein [Planctomycetota bacterium]|jgi:uncharacterized damage-inducible protein DinB
METDFCRESAQYLRDVYLPRMRRAVAELPPDELWWRPNDETTSVGNLLLHLEGNVRQWILSGIGGEPDARERQTEFDAREGRDAQALLDALGATVAAAALVIEGIDPRRMLTPMTIQGIETTPMAAVYHVVEHFSWHTGQVTWIAKARAGGGHGIAFYDDAALNAARNRGGEPA